MAIGIGAFFYLELQREHPFWEKLDLTQGLVGLLKALAFLTILSLLFHTFRARKSLVILGFSDYTGEPAQKMLVDGLASRLRAELAAIAAMYKVLDEAWSAPLADPVKLSPSVRDPGDLLQGVATPDTKISLGFVQIPLGAVFAAFSRLVQG
ncbi:MAG TPA: hypothetical protein VHQ90_06135 [Thermoanaerobaculia bacterium]|nr:hypothetical protein [Thermoanaerobaculia bacterium]